MNVKPALTLLIATAPCWAQTAPAPSGRVDGGVVRVVQTDDRVDRGEPQVRHTVIEDDSSKIDELRVRGQVTQVVVTPKVGTLKPYEIIMNRSGREPVDGNGGASSAVGKRVWNVLAF